MPDRYNIVLLGPLGCGKSALTVRYLSKRFISEYDPYIDAKYTKHDVINGEDRIVKVWDTFSHAWSCNELEKYMDWADGFLIVYSITSRPSFKGAEHFLNNLIKQFSRRQLAVKPIALVGNKLDLDVARQVSHCEGSSLATQYHSLFTESTAAGDYSYTQNVFHSVICDIQQERELIQPSELCTLADAPSLTTSLPKSLTKRSKGSKTPSPKPLKKSTSMSFKIFNKALNIFT